MVVILIIALYFIVWMFIKLLSSLCFQYTGDLIELCLILDVNSPIRSWNTQFDQKIWEKCKLYCNFVFLHSWFTDNTVMEILPNPQIQTIYPDLKRLVSKTDGKEAQLIKERENKSSFWWMKHSNSLKKTSTWKLGKLRFWKITAHLVDVLLWRD